MTTRFSNPIARLTIAAGGIGFALIGLGGLQANDSNTGARLFAVAMLVVGAWFVFRAARGPMVIVSSSQVTTRSFVRTRRFDLDTLQSVEVAVGSVTPISGRRDYLVFNAAGAQYPLREMNSLHRKGRADNVVHRAARCINDRLSVLHSWTSPA